MRFHLVCASIFSIQILYECRRGDLAGFDTPPLPNRLYSLFHAPTVSPSLPADSKTDSKTV
jgi:hypothetical protein